MINNILLIDNHTKQILLQKIRDLMDELKCYDDQKYSIIDNHLETANKEMLASMKSHTFLFPQEQVKQINDYIKKQNNLFSQLSNVEKIDKLLLELLPLSIEEIRKNIEASKGTFTSIITEHIINSDGKVINYKKLSDNELFSLKANQYIQFNIDLILDLLVNPFFNNLIIDNEVIVYLKNIMSNNQMISNDRIEMMTDYFIAFLKQDFKNSVYDILEELEESLRYYFKNLKMNIYKKNGKNDLIGLSTIFNDKTNNTYRDKILEVIDEDYFFTLKWFLVDNYGYGLRNRIAHRYNSKDLYMSTYSIYITFMILRLYWGFQN